MGRIGEAVAKRAKFGFDMNVLYYNRRRKEEAEQKFDAAYCDLHTLLKQSDFIVLLTPLTEETYQLIEEKESVIILNKLCYAAAHRICDIKEKTPNANDRGREFSCRVTRKNPA